MKKLFLLILTSLSCLVSYAAASVTLWHKGAVSVYDASSLSTALANAVDGDTIFLAEGSYSGFSLTKQVTVRGEGNSTKITGEVSVNIPDKPELTQTLLQGLNMSGYTLKLLSVMKGVTIKQCQITNFTVSESNEDIILDRCKISTSLYQSSSMKSLKAYNCKIYNISYSSTCDMNSCTFINCDIYCLNQYSGSISGNFVNSIILSYDSKSTMNNCNFINCLHGFIWKLTASSSEQNCYYDSSLKMNSSTLTTEYSAEKLESYGYLGNEGTVVGSEGGVNPYSLTIAVPTITSSNISFDNENKQMTVSLKVNY